MPEIFDEFGQRREPSEFKRIDVIDEVNYLVLLALFNSNTFYMYFTVFSDNRNVNIRELAAFPFFKPSNEVSQRLSELAQDLMRNMRINSEMRVCHYKSIGTIRNQYFFQGRCKPLIDKIDRVLAKHYGFTQEELDFIINYDIKYRMGKDNEEETDT